MRKIELLMPAGSLETLKIAILYGADAVYVGGEMFSLRANAKNFTNQELREGIEYAHERDVKVYITANIFAHNDNIKDVENYFIELKKMKPDAILIADPGIFSIAKRVIPEIDIHISTQANNTNHETYKFWWKLGAKRVVSARELSLLEIKEIRKHIPDEMEIESFVHGSMCMSYSGRCLISNFLTGRDANQGNCTHPCRWKYSIVEESRPKEYIPVIENEQGTYIFNSKDLCMIEYIPEMIDAGIDSLKIEGRMKTVLYVATVARTYRKAIDDYMQSPKKFYENLEWYKNEIGKITYREYTTGFYFGKPMSDAQIYDSHNYVKNYTYLGIILHITKDGLCKIEQKNKFSVGDMVEVIKADGRNLICKVECIMNEDGQSQDSAPHPKQLIYINIGTGISINDILRKPEI